MIERRGEYEYTTVFSLNNFYGESVVGEFFNTPFVTVVPRLVEFDIDGPNPSGFRHLTTHAAFKKIVASGANRVSMNVGPLDFGVTNISVGSGISCTRCFIFRIHEFDCATTRVHNMKVWASDTSDFLTPEDFRIIWDTRRGNAFPSGFQFDVSTLIDKSLHLSTSIPEAQNLRRHDGGVTIHGSGDLDVSEYILMAVAASGTLPLAEYIGDPEGFVVRVTYSVDNIERFKD